MLWCLFKNYDFLTKKTCLFVLVSAFWAKYYIYARKFMKTRKLGQFWNTFLYISQSKCRVYNTKISWVPISKKKKRKRHSPKVAKPFVLLWISRYFDKLRLLWNYMVQKMVLGEKQNVKMDYC